MRKKDWIKPNAKCYRKITRTRKEIEEDRIKKISDTLSTRENEKKMRILEYRNFPNVKDNKEAFCEIGFSERFSSRKKERHEFMKAASYKLTNGVWYFTKNIESC